MGSSWGAPGHCADLGGSLVAGAHVALTHVAGSEDAAALALINGRAGVMRGAQEPDGSLEKAQ